MSNNYIYCFIRKDLRVVHQIIQMSHACFEIGNFEEPSDTPNMVLFEVENEQELLQIWQYLYELDITLSIFREPDMNDECTAICTQIIPGNSEKREIFRDFKLYNDPRQ